MRATEAYGITEDVAEERLASIAPCEMKAFFVERGKTKTGNNNFISNQTNKNNEYQFHFKSDRQK